MKYLLTVALDMKELRELYAESKISQSQPMQKVMQAARLLAFGHDHPCPNCDNIFGCDDPACYGERYRYRPCHRCEQIAEELRQVRLMAERDGSS